MLEGAAECKLTDLRTKLCLSKSLAKMNEEEDISISTLSSACQIRDKNYIIMRLPEI